ncbi:hypothetical protein D3C86_1762050 [compost metagenome]
MQGPTSKPETAPRTPAPMRLPPRWLRETFSRRSRTATGNCNSKKPNIGNASSTNTAAKVPSNQGFCSNACRFAPSSAASTPIAAYTSAMQIT